MGRTKMRLYLEYYLIIQDQQGKEIRDIPLEVNVYIDKKECVIESVYVDGKIATPAVETFLVETIGRQRIIDKSVSLFQGDGL